MNADGLLAHYDRIADAPDATSRVRRFIIDLAVCGKLVPQEATWQTVKIEGCLEALADGRFIHQGWSPQCERHPSPNGKVWGVLKTTAIQDGFYLEDQNKELPANLAPKPMLEVRAGDILITCAGPRARCGIACLVQVTRERLTISGKMYRFRANEKIVSREYLALFLRAKEVQAAINAMKTGSSESGLNLTQDRFRTLEVSFSTIDEQGRIVAKVDELMLLCDRLEAARTAREKTRDRLTVASLARLNTPDPETFQNDARFVLNALPAITKRPDQINQLRQTILNLAVRGKLVPQDAKEEPVKVTLRKAMARRAELVRAKKVRQKKLDGYDDLAADAELPSSWVLERLGNLVDPENTISYGVLVPGDEVPDGVPFVRAQDLALSSHPERPNKTISPEIEKAYARTRLRGGEILVCVVGSIGKLGIVPQSWAGANIARAVARISPISEISREYLLVVLRGEPVQSYFGETTRTLAQPTLNVGLIEQTPIPLPPLAEQHRIVAKVDELMALCDQLEASLTDTAAARRRLLDALLAKALAPADAREMEAAE